MSNFIKINQKYIKNFKNRVISRYKGDNIKTDTTFLRSIFKEIDELFKKIKGRLSNKSMIPGQTEYPDSSKFNNLTRNIGIDIDKLYISHDVLEDDINKILNFNYRRRQKTYENLTDTQQNIHSTYIKNKKLLDGSTRVPAENPFGSSDNLSDESNNIKIENNKLSLDYEENTSKSVDIDNVQCFFSKKPNINLYPNKNALAIGSHWKMPNKDGHFDRVDDYRTLMIDDKNNNMGIGHCEFESVITTLNRYSLHELKSYIGEKQNKDRELIICDLNNSLQGKYSLIGRYTTKSIDTDIKLSIPFKNDAPLTNEIYINFDCPRDPPDINFDESKIYHQDEAYSFIPSESEDGSYILRINNAFIKPTRVELIISYNKHQWLPIDFYMSWYTYSANKQYTLQHGDNEIKLLLSKSYDIFVDTEVDENSEKSRAVKVL